MALATVTPRGTPKLARKIRLLLHFRVAKIRNRFPNWNFSWIEARKRAFSFRVGLFSVVLLWRCFWPLLCSPHSISQRMISWYLPRVPPGVALHQEIQLSVSPLSLHAPLSFPQFYRFTLLNMLLGSMATTTRTRRSSPILNFPHPPFSNAHYPSCPQYYFSPVYFYYCSKTVRLAHVLSFGPQVSSVEDPRGTQPFSLPVWCSPSILGRKLSSKKTWATTGERKSETCLISFRLLFFCFRLESYQECSSTATSDKSSTRRIFHSTSSILLCPT